MARRYLPFLVSAGLVALAACAGQTTDDSDTSTASADAGTKSRVDAGGSTSTPPSSSSDASTGEDAGARDAATSDDASADAGPGDSGADVDAGCSGAGANLALCATATATSEYSGYPATALNDGALDVSWYSEIGACPSGTCLDDTVHADLTFDTPRTVGRVKLWGNRDGYESGYDVLTARIDLLDGVGTVLGTANVTTTRGAEPNGDADQAFMPVVANVKSVRLTVLTGESTEPGLGEIEIYAN